MPRYFSPREAPPPAETTVDDPVAVWPRGKMCHSCAGIPGTDAARSPKTVATLQECIRTGEPFYCHESVAELDPNGTATDRHGNVYRHLPESRWRLCRAWMNARAALESAARSRLADMGKME